MTTFLNKVMRWAGIGTLVFLALACAGCASAPDPQEQLRTAVIQPCKIDDITPFNVPYDRCDAVKKKLAEKTHTAPASVGQKEKLVDCVLPEDQKEYRLSLSECREKRGHLLGGEVAISEKNAALLRTAPVVRRNNDCDPSGWFCGAPPPRPYLGSPFYSGASSAYTYTQVNVGRSSRYGTYWNVRTQSYQRW